MFQGIWAINATGEAYVATRTRNFPVTVITHMVNPFDSNKMYARVQTTPCGTCAYQDVTIMAGDPYSFS
jgi:hypothetical protein